MDATTVSAPGSDGADWRLHVGFDVAAGVVDAVTLTDGRGGEHLGRFPAERGDLLVADRGYAHEDRLWSVVEGGVDVLVRVNPHQAPFDLVAAAR